MFPDAEMTVNTQNINTNMAAAKKIFEELKTQSAAAPDFLAPKYIN